MRHNAIIAKRGGEEENMEGEGAQIGSERANACLLAAASELSKMGTAHGKQRKGINSVLLRPGTVKERRSEKKRNGKPTTSKRGYGWTFAGWI